MRIHTLLPGCLIVRVLTHFCLLLRQPLLSSSVLLRGSCMCVQVDFVQAGNLSWFGYPEDTIPSARNFLPLSKVRKEATIRLSIRNVIVSNEASFAATNSV